MTKNILLRDGEASLPRAVACAVYPQGGEEECTVSLAELARLLDTAGAESVPSPRVGISLTVPPVSAAARCGNCPRSARR